MQVHSAPMVSATRVPRLARGTLPRPGLPHKGGVGRAEGLLRQQGKLIELAVNGPARRAVRAEGVDIGLHEYVGKRGDRALQGGGQADAYNLPEHRQLDAQPAEEQLIRAVRARQHIQHQRSGERLRQDGRVSYARNAHVEHQHKDQIARRVDNGRENQKIQRTAAVAHGAQDARAML